MERDGFGWLTAGAGLLIGCSLQIVAFVAGAASMLLTFVYLLDKDWNILLAGIVTLSIIGSLITAAYAVVADGYWWPLVLGVLSSVLISVMSPPSRHDHDRVW